jgi:hypothetical protein
MATVLTALAGLLTAGHAAMKPRDDTATKATYEQLTIEINALSKTVIEQHASLVALRAYVDGLTRAGLDRGEGIGLGSVGTLGHGAGSGRLGGAPKRPAASAPKAASAPPPMPPPPMPPPPPVAEAKASAPPSFDELKAQHAL